MLKCDKFNLDFAFARDREETKYAAVNLAS